MCMYNCYGNNMKQIQIQENEKTISFILTKYGKNRKNRKINPSKIINGFGPIVNKTFQNNNYFKSNFDDDELCEKIYDYEDYNMTKYKKLKKNDTDNTLIKKLNKKNTDNILIKNFLRYRDYYLWNGRDKIFYLSNKLIKEKIANRLIFIYNGNEIIGKK